MHGLSRNVIFGGLSLAAVSLCLVALSVGPQELISLPLEDVTFDAGAFWKFFASLFAIMNPLVAIPFFVSLTEKKSVAVRNRLATITTGTVMIALMMAAIFGREILAFFAISIGSFRIAGGIIVLSMGLALLRAQGMGKDDGGAESGRSDSEAVCPLAIPLLAGPGSIATIIIACEGAERACDFITIGSVIAAMVAVTYVTLRLAVPLARALGPSGLMVVTRLIGMIVAAIAIDMLVVGVLIHFPGLG